VRQRTKNIKDEKTRALIRELEDENADVDQLFDKCEEFENYYKQCLAHEGLIYILLFIQIDDLDEQKVLKPSKEKPEDILKQVIDGINFFEANDNEWD